MIVRRVKRSHSHPAILVMMKRIHYKYGTYKISSIVDSQGINTVDSSFTNCCGGFNAKLQPYAIPREAFIDCRIPLVGRHLFLILLLTFFCVFGAAIDFRFSRETPKSYCQSIAQHGLWLLKTHTLQLPTRFYQVNSPIRPLTFDLSSDDTEPPSIVPPLFNSPKISSTPSNPVRKATAPAPKTSNSTYKTASLLS